VREPTVPIESEAGWNPESVWMDWRRDELLGLPGIEQSFLAHPSPILVTVVTELLLTLMRNVLEMFYLEDRYRNWRIIMKLEVKNVRRFN
jgi:hypothetical protein